MALLRPGRCGYCRRSGCLQSRAEAQRPPKGQHAGGTPALPGTAGPALPCGSFEEKRPIVDEDEPPMDTNRPEDRWTCFNHKGRHNASAILQCCALGVTMSWNDGFLGARASRPHQAWHSLAHLPHLDRPGTAPWLSFGLAAAVTADVVAACKAARKLSDHQRDSMRAGRPRSRGQSLPLWRGSRRSRAGRRRLLRLGGRSAPGNRYFFMNMDAQDAQDKQDEGLLRGEPARAMIRCGFADAQDYKPAVS